MTTPITHGSAHGVARGLPKSVRCTLSSNPILDWLLSDDDQIDWLIPGLIPRNYVITLIAGEGAGKSTLSYTLSMALATGSTVLNTAPTSPQTVLYFDMENGKPDAVRYAKRAYYGLGRPSLTLLEEHLWIEHFTLGSADWKRTAEARVKAVRPALIVFDTAISCCPPLTAKGEDDNAEASRTITAIKQLCQMVTPHASSLILKHAKTFPVGVQEYDLRGAKAWKGAADSVLFLVKHKAPGRAGHTTTLLPLKSRAFGLQQELHIKPTWVEDGKGLRLELWEGTTGAELGRP